jgi:hypothetical protein
MIAGRELNSPNHHHMEKQTMKGVKHVLLSLSTPMSVICRDDVKARKIIYNYKAPSTWYQSCQLGSAEFCEVMAL